MVHSTVAHLLDCPACSHAGGKPEIRQSLVHSGKDLALALSLAGFGRMTAWRQGSFVKAAAHFERATTCLTRSLSMFRLVGVGSRPDLLGCRGVPSPQNWLSL